MNGEATTAKPNGRRRVGLTELGQGFGVIPLGFATDASRFGAGSFTLFVLVFPILLCSQDSPSDEVPGAAPDYSKWPPYESEDPKVTITIESVEIPVSEPAPTFGKSIEKPRQFRSKWTILNKKNLFFWD